MAADAPVCPFVVVAKEWKQIDALPAPEPLQPKRERFNHPIELQKQVVCHSLLKGRASITKLSAIWDNV